jgi:DNA polymerase I
MKGLLLDISYGAEEGKLATRLYVKTAKGTQVIEDSEFAPYFYLTTKQAPSAIKLEGVKEVVRRDADTLKVVCSTPADVPKAREKAKLLGKVSEADVPFTQRYLIDHALKPMQTYEWDGLKFAPTDGDIALKRVAMDFETYNQRGFSVADKDPILLAAAHDGKEDHVFTWKKIKRPFVTTSKDEKSALEGFAKAMQEADVVYTYNGDNFDLPYLRERMKTLKIEHGLGLGGEQTRFRNTQRGVTALIPGKAHVDVYQAISFLARIGALKLPRYTLADVYAEISGKKKVLIDKKSIWKTWDSGKGLEELADYNLDDAHATWELGEHVLPLYTAFAKLVGSTLSDVCRMSTGQMVEQLLLSSSFQRGVIAPNKPGHGELAARSQSPIEGGFVKTPPAGLHDRVAVLDFRGLYPSIIISHNISPETLGCKCCEDAFVSPQGHRFCRKHKGIIPEMLETLVKNRIAVKKRMREATGKEKVRLDAEQWALKIVANSTYGYTLYARARWYSRQCGESTTAWARHYVHDLIAKAEQAGFEVLYADTDSAFLKLGDKTKEDVVAFVKEYNTHLPEAMAVEFEGYYPRCIFVTRRVGGAAKKRYALLREDGQVEITGLEFVRRDWSALAKNAQQRVVQAVLENKVEEAKKIVLQTIEGVRANTFPLDDFVIYTQLKRRTGNYDAVGPHVKAAMRLEKSGETVGAGTTIGYVVTQGSGNIGDRAYPVELVGNRKPDADYYVNNQLLPAVMKILAELGIKEDELTTKGKQTGLSQWD